MVIRLHQTGVYIIDSEANCHAGDVITNRAFQSRWGIGPPELSRECLRVGLINVEEFRQQWILIWQPYAPRDNAIEVRKEKILSSRLRRYISSLNPATLKGRFCTSSVF
jgi:hypothetical protein